MASTYSTNLALELMATGEKANTWGDITNTNLGTLLEQAISGYVTQAITDGSGATTTITIPNGATGVARNMYIEMTGALTFSTTSLIVPANKKLYFIYNNTTGGYPVQVKVSGQTGVSVPNGQKVVLVSNGTDVVVATNYMATLAVGSLTSGRVPYATTNGLLTNSANLTFDGTTLTAGGLSSPTLTNAGTLALSATSTNIITASTNGSERMRIDSSGNVGIGTTSTTARRLTVGGSMTGATGAYGALVSPTIQPDVTVNALVIASQAATAANGGTPYTVAALTCFNAAQSTFNADSTVTNQYGFAAAGSLTGATNNYGFYGNIASGTGRWNMYMSGTAQNYIAGNVGIGSGKTVPAYALDVNGTVAASTSVITPSVTNAGTLALSATGANILTASTNGTERLRITSNGGVSFGATGTAYGTSGQVLTSNGDAAPTWQTASGITTGKSIAMAMIFGF